MRFAAPAMPQRWMPHRWERCRRRRYSCRGRDGLSRGADARRGSARGRAAALARGAAQSLVAHAARADDGDAVAVLCRVGGAKPEALREACESNAWKVAATLLVCGADATGAAHVARRCGHAHLAMAIDAGLDAQLTNGATLRAYARDGATATRWPGTVPPRGTAGH